jgi:hypothetical protein
MSTAERIAVLRQRAERCQEAVATFMRIREELLVMRKDSAIGVARDRIDGMIKLNQETLEAIKRGLTIAEGELRRAEIA